MRNVVKNIFRLFKRWVNESDSCHRKKYLNSSLEKMLAKNVHFNNTLIIKISKKA